MDDPQMINRSVTLRYAFMWGWAYYFLHSTEKHRRLLLQAIREEQRIHRAQAWNVDPRQVYPDCLEKAGMPVPSLDKGFKKFIRELGWDGTSKRR